MIAWDASFRGRYDSPWCVAQKLAWLNTSRVNEILATIVGRSTPFKESDRTHTFADLQWCTRAPAKADRGLSSAATGGITDILTLLAPRAIVSFLYVARPLMSEDLRLCPSCTLLGYHSVVHQIAGLERCPIHGDPLIEACPVCRRHFGAYNIRRAHAFACPHCGNSLLANSLLTVFPTELKVAEKRRIAPILAWIRRMVPSIPCSSQNMVLGTRQSDCYSLVPLEKAILPLLATISPFPLHKHLLSASVPGLALDVKPAASWQPWEQVALEITEPVEYCVRVHNAVTNEVMDSLGKHLACFSHGAEVVRGTDAHYLVFHSGFCVQAYALALWKLRTGMLLKQLREFTRPTTLQVWLDIHDLRSRLLSEYFYCLHTTEVLHGLHVQGDDKSVRNALCLGALRSSPGPWLNIVGVTLPGQPVDTRPCPRLKFTSNDLGCEYYCDHGAAINAYVRRLLAISSAAMN